jgi:hypothetical protein
MADQMVITLSAENTSPFVLTADTVAPFVLTTATSGPVTIQMGASLTGNVGLTGPSSLKGFEGFAAGVVDNQETILAAIIPYNFTANVANCEATAIQAAASQVVFSIVRTRSSIATQIGTVTFNAGSKNGVFIFTATDFIKGDIVSIVAPINPDSALSDITFLVAE